MRALILNSGMGKRMGDITRSHPKCMTSLTQADTILSRQLRLLSMSGVQEAVITTGLFAPALEEYVLSLGLHLKYTFVHNPRYESTNYIYSIYLAREYLDDDIVLMHGDLVFAPAVLDGVLEAEGSVMAVSSTLELPDKDFKAVLRDDRIVKVGVSFFDGAVAAQPLYKLEKAQWQKWLDEISRFCQDGQVSCYAENALNELNGAVDLAPYDVRDQLCNEVDTPGDLAVVRERVKELEMKTVYMCFATDVIHGGHIAIIQKAAKLGRLTIGVLSDEAAATYRRFPLLPMEERMEILKSIAGVGRVVEQRELGYRENLTRYKPDYLVHGDDWQEGFQAVIRQEAISVLSSYGGKLVEFPYTRNPKYELLERNAREQLSIPDARRGRLRRLLKLKKPVTILEAHNGITGLIVEKTCVYKDGKACQFDGMWVSSLCDSTAKGKPDIELVDMSSRLRTIDEIMEVTTKPMILDGDTGGQIEHFVYNVRTLERMGVSAVIIEDKTGLKKNSLFGVEADQTQDSIENFSQKIRAGKQAQKTREFMIIARIESLILEKGMEDALLRAFAFVGAGADGIMIHSRKKEPDEIYEFCRRFRERDQVTPLVAVPTAFHAATEAELAAHGVNLVIYANHLTRSGFPAMRKTAETILTHGRALEADELLMPISEILTLIPEE